MTEGALIWDDPDNDQWSKITQIIVHHRSKDLPAP